MKIQARITDTLDRCVDLPAGDLQRFQQRLLERLCRHAATHVPGYRRSIAGLFVGQDPVGGDWKPYRWTNVPIVERVEMAANATDFQSPEMDAHDFKPGETSGSTGKPLAYRKSVIGNFASIGVADRAFRKFGFDMAGSFADIRVLLLTKAAQARKRRWNASEQSGIQHVFDIRRPVEEQWAWLLQVAPDYLMSYPSNLDALCRFAGNHSDPPRLKACIGSAEILTDAIRARIASAFGVETLSLYGLRELGHVASGCPQSRQLHIAADVTMLEVIRDDGETAREGEIGQVVATSFYNYAMPFIRYATGDYAEVGEPCGCGWTLPTLKRIVGRRRNRFRLGDDRLVWPAFLFDGIEQKLGLDDFRLIQTAPDAFDFHYVRSSGQPDLPQPQLVSALSSGFMREVTAEPYRTTAIEPSGYAKQERFISTLEDPKYAMG